MNGGSGLAAACVHKRFLGTPFAFLFSSSKVFCIASWKIRAFITANLRSVQDDFVIQYTLPEHVLMPGQLRMEIATRLHFFFKFRLSRFLRRKSSPYVWGCLSAINLYFIPKVNPQIGMMWGKTALIFAWILLRAPRSTWGPRIKHRIEMRAKDYPPTVVHHVL